MTDGEITETEMNAFERLRESVIDFIAVLVYSWGWHFWMLFVSLVVITGYLGPRVGVIFLVGALGGIIATTSAWLSEISSREKAKRSGRKLKHDEFQQIVHNMTWGDDLPWSPNKVEWINNGGEYKRVDKPDDATKSP